LIEESWEVDTFMKKLFSLLSALKTLLRAKGNGMAGESHLDI
jgi:hypothetical protein